jgi:hypothetical protein
VRHSLLALWFGAVASAAADTIVVPSRAASIGGSGSFTVLLDAMPHSYMCAIGVAELNGRIPPGAHITALAWRRPSWQPHAPWPAVAASFEDFDIYLAQAARPAGMLSLAEPLKNIGSDLTLVRSGPINFKSGSFPGGALSPAANPFSAPIAFDTPYVYRGGELLLMVRHTGNSAPSGSLDWVSSFYAGSGAQAISIDSYIQNANWNLLATAGCIAVEFTFSSPPEPTCYANCDQSTTEPTLNIADFACFLARFADADPYANCDQSTTDPILNIADFTCFLIRFAAGCK